MAYQGQVRNGVVVFDEPVSLPEGTRVQIEPVEETAAKTIAQRFENVIGSGVDLPEDLAKNHDYYLHGTGEQ